MYYLPERWKREEEEIGYRMRADLLLFQIPFFFGAYGLLSHHEGLRRAGLFFVADLGRLPREREVGF